MKIIVPEKWSEVSVEQYVKISKLDVSDNMNYVINIISILSDIPRETMLNVPYGELERLSGLITWMSEMPNTILQDEYKLGKDRYRNVKPADLSIGEMISYEMIIDKHKLVDMECLPYILALLLRKNVNGKMESFDASKIYDNAELFNTMSIDQVLGLLFFFRSGGMTYTEILEASLRDQQMKI